MPHIAAELAKELEIEKNGAAVEGRCDHNDKVQSTVDWHEYPTRSGEIIEERHEAKSENHYRMWELRLFS